MKKWIMLAATGFMMANAQASESWCGFKDYFRLSDDSHPGLYIVSALSDPDLVLQLVGPRSFIIKDTIECKSGYAHVTVGYDQNWCVLDIQDGPWMNHPSVKASCSGVKYLGTTHDGFGGHSYTINLD